MNLFRLFRSAKSRKPLTHRRPPRLRLEALEDRLVPSTLTVNTLLDENDGIGVGGVSLRDAISAAAPGDAIDFSVTGTISLAHGQLPTIAQDLTITGPGAGSLTIDANHASRVLEVSSGVTVGLSGLTLANGTVAGSGAGIRNGGTLWVTNSTLSGNSARNGGGIFNNGTVSVTNSTLSGNSATLGGGGIFNNFGTASVTNSTLSGNSASSGGGGFNYATLSVTNSTLSGNSASSGGGIYTYHTGTLSVTNSIVANSSGGDLVNFGSYSGSHNLTGTVALGPLQNNGGPTMTHALPAGSPAIDAGSDALAVDPAGDPLATDQRGPGFPRFNNTVDIGAFEFDATDFVVTTLADEDDGSADPSLGTGTSLREAIAAANGDAGAEAITFAPGLTGTINLAHGQLTIASDMTISGPGAGTLTIDAHHASRVLAVGGGAVVGLSGLTIANGSADFGAGIVNSGTLSVTNSTLSGNYAYDGQGAFGGGGILNVGTLSVTNSTLSGNSTGDGQGSLGGGGILNVGTLSVTNSTLSGNAAPIGAGISNYSTVSVTNSTLSGNAGIYGGGIFNDGTLSVTNSTLSGNSAYFGGGIFNDGTLSVTNSTLSGNAGIYGGGILNAGTLSVTNSIVANSSGSDIFGAYSGSHNLFGPVALGPLQNNGGPTMTHALPAGSPAIDAGDDALAVDPDGNPLIYDQRGPGFPRFSGTVDIGAFEDLLSFVVTTLADEDDGSADPSLGTGTSLREAIAAANGDAGAEAITFAPGLTGTITLTGTQLPTVTGDVTITGPGAGALTLDANHASRVLEVSSGVTVGLSGLTLANGTVTGDGGGIRNFGTLTITGIALTGNTARANGGGLYNSGGAVTLTDSTVSGNTALWGAGLYNRGSGTMAVFGSTLSGNSADETGGGIYNRGTLSVTNSTLSGNAATNGGGGIYNRGTLSVTNSTFSGNSAVYGGGGGIYNYGTASVTNSTLSGNAASFGGGIFNNEELTVTNSTLSGNSAEQGGALYNEGRLSVTDSTLSGNSADQGGGIFNFYKLTLINSTLSGNNAASDRGGAIFNYGTVTAIHSTLTGNNAAGGGGGIYSKYLNSYFVPGSTTLRNTIVAGNSVGSATASDLSGQNVEAASSHNLIGDAASAGGLTNGVNGNLVGVDPLLGPLADNGGPTMTHALPTGSPAINAGSDALAVDKDGNPLIYDQRGPGFARILGAHVDIGAFEIDNQAPTDIALSNSSVAENQPVGTTVGTFSTTDPDVGDTFTYTLVSGTGDADNASFTIDAGGNLQTAASFDFEAKSSYSIRVRSTDAGGEFVEKTFTVSVSNVNEAPTDVALSNASVAENQPSGTTVGSFSTTDPDAGDTFTYALVGGTGDADNASFTIDAGGNLQTAASFNFEAKNSYSIRVRTTDAGGLTFEKVFTISVTNVNDAPTDIALSNSSVAENQAVGTVVGNLSSTDQDAGDTFSYSLVSGTGSTDNASFTIDAGGNLQTAASFNYEVKNSYSIRVRTTDADGLSVEKVFTVTVTNVNEAPTDVALSNASVAENQPSGTTVGTLSTTDPDAGDTFTYSLVSGTGDADNASFTIDASGNLQTAASFDFEAKSSYSIRVRSTDAGGLSFEKVFTVSVTNVNEAPTVAAPASVTAYQNVDQPFTGGNAISVADPDGGSLTVTLAVGHGKLTLGTTSGLTVTGNGTASVTLAGTIAALNAALATLVYRGNLNFSGSDALSIAASDGGLSASRSVALAVQSPAQQAATLQGLVTSLETAGVLNNGQASSLLTKVTLQGNAGDAGRVRAFLNQVADLLADGVLTQAQADSLLIPGNLLLQSLGG